RPEPAGGGERRQQEVARAADDHPFGRAGQRPRDGGDGRRDLSREPLVSLAGQRQALLVRARLQIGTQHARQPRPRRRGRRRAAANVAWASQFAEATFSASARACPTPTKSPSFVHVATGASPATAATASRMWFTPSRLPAKQSHSSPVMVTARRSKAGQASST